MFGFHPDKQLVAYCQKELDAEKARRIEAHLERCARCRQQVEALRHAHESLSHLPSLSAPDALWNRIEAALPEAPAVVASGPIEHRPGRFRRQLTFATAALMVMVGLVSWRLLYHPPRPNGPALAVTRLAGAPRVGSDRIKSQDRLGKGEYLETDANSRAEIKVANIGTVQVEPNTRIGLKETGPNEHRLDLEHGEMQATVKAPPRLFLVDTPVATAVDLGCAYTLKVDEAGNTWLHVTSGKVALEIHGQVVTVFHNAICETRKGLGTGTPYLADTSPAFQQALRRLDFEQGNDADLNTILKEARLDDTLTLFHLLYRVNETQRGQIIDRMIELMPPPTGVTRANALRLDKKTLDLWRDDLTVLWE